MNGRLRSTSVPSKRAPEEVLLAVLGAHPSLPRPEIPRKRNPEEIKAAFEDFKLRAHNVLEQLSQDQRSA